MKRRRIILGCTLAAVAAGVFVLWPRGPAEPVYQGKGLSQWLEAASRISPATFNYDYDKAKEAVRAVGPSALPWLMSELTRSEPAWRARLYHWADRITAGRLGLDSDKDRVWNAAAVGLRLLCPDAAPALPELDRLLHGGDPLLAFRAAQAMAGGGEAALPYLLRGMNSTNEHVQSYCKQGLAWLAHTTAAATPHLVRLFESPSRDERVMAAGHLGEVTSHPELTVPALTIALWDPDLRVRTVASFSFSSMRTNSALAEALRRQMQDTNPAVVLTASNALHLLAHGPPPDPLVMAEAGESALPYVLQCFASTNTTVVTRSVAALGVLARTMEAAVPPLVQALQSTNNLVRRFAVVNLGGVRFHPELTIPALAAATSDTDAEVASGAAWRLSYLQTNAAELVAELRRSMAGTNAISALNASNALYLLETANAARAQGRALP